MRGKPLLIVSLLVVVAAVVLFMLRQLDQASPVTQGPTVVTTTHTPLPSNNPGGRSPALPPPQVDPTPPPEVSGALEIPLPRVSGLSYVRLDASLVEAPKPVIRVEGTSANPEVWEALLRLAVEVARRSDGRQVRVDLNVRDLPPRLEYTLPLALGLRLRLQGREWPGKVLVAGFPAPDGVILPVIDATYVQGVAASVGWVLDRATDAQTLFAAWAPVGPDHWSGCSGAAGTARVVAARPAAGHEAPLEPLVPNEDLVAREVAEVVGVLAAGGEVPSRTREDPERRLKMLEGSLLAAGALGPEDLLNQGWMAAQLRASGRVSVLVAERLPQVARLVAKAARPSSRGGRPGPLEPQLSTWVTALIRAEQESRVTTSVLGREAGRLAPGPRAFVAEKGAELQARTRSLAALSDALGVVLAWRIPTPRRLPHPYPWTDVMMLDASRPLPPESRNPVADYGVALLRATNLWSAAAIVAAWDPKVDARAGTLVVAHPEEPVNQVRASLERVDRCRTAPPRALPAVPMEVPRLVATSTYYRHRDPAGMDVAATLHSLAAAWQATVLLDEMTVLAAQLR